jgi:DNA polymerase
LSGAKDILEDIRDSDDIYEAFANFFGMYDGDKPLKEADPKLRHRVKTMVLGCGYGVGPKKFALISGMSEDEAEDAVDLYREKMYRVVGYWNRLARDLSKSNLTDKKYITRLPSGRRLNYGVIQSHPREGNPDRPARDHFAHIVKNSARRPVKVYGGLLAENASQALARDIFSDALVRMHNEGMQIVCHVHDEVLVEVDADEADETLDRVIEIFKTPPEWIPDIPLDAEGKVLTRYEK